MEKQFCFNYEHYAALAELSDADRELVREAERATANANAPYSKFRVGAAARLRSGKILYGSNFESEVYPAAAALHVRALTRSEHVRDTGFGGAARRRRRNVALKYRPLLEIPEKCSLPKISSTKTIIC